MTVNQILKEQFNASYRLDRNTRRKWRELVDVGAVSLDPAKTAASIAIRGALTGPFGRAIERQVTASFDFLHRLQARVEQTGPGVLRRMVNRWDQFLAIAVEEATGDSPFADISVLVGFSVVEDQNLTLNQTELGRLIADVAGCGGLSDAAVREKANSRSRSRANLKGDSLDDAVWDGIDVLAHILVAMRRQGLKPAVKDPDLQQFLIEFFTASPAVKKTFGGAAGNESFVLTEMGCPVLVHMPYHHPEQAGIAPDGARRLVFDRNEVIPTFPCRGVGCSDDPRRFSLVMQLTLPGPVFLVGSTSYSLSRADRIIFRVQNPRTDTASDWQKLQVRWRGPSSWEKAPSGAQYNSETDYWCMEVDRSHLNEFLPNDWPYLFVFQHRAMVERDVLEIELAAVDDLASVGENEKVKAALLGGIQVLAKTAETAMTDYPPDFRCFLREVLVEQLKALSSRGVSLHLELNSVESGEQLEVLQDIFDRAGLRNLSLNREELVQITSEYGSPFYTAPRSGGLDTTMEIYCRSAELLKRLKVDTLYVHDIELDLLVRREPDEDKASAHATLERHRQAMLLAKAVLPAVLFERAGAADHSWDLVFSTESLAALLAFANDYAVRFPAASRAAVEENLLTKGYCYPGLDKVSVVVSPTLCVDFPEQVSLSGAGDMCFAVHGAISSRRGL